MPHCNDCAATAAVQPQHGKQMRSAPRNQPCCNCKRGHRANRNVPLKNQKTLSREYNDTKGYS
jgi:hypothetical protein